MLSMLRKKKKDCLFFFPYSTHFVGKHSYKKIEGGLYPCTSKENAVAIISDLLDAGHFDSHMAGIIILGGGDVVDRMTRREIFAAIEATKQNKGR